MKKATESTTERNQISSLLECAYFCYCMQALPLGVLTKETSTTDAFSKMTRVLSGKSTKEFKLPMRPRVTSSYFRPPLKVALSFFERKDYSQGNILAPLALER